MEILLKKHRNSDFKKINMWNSLPNELQLHILGFTYLPQKKELIDDIQTFYRFTARTSDCYNRRWIIEMQSILPEDANWLANDIGRFLNKNHPTLFYGYLPQYTDVLQRMYKLNNSSPSQLRKNIIQLEDQPAKVHIKVVSALMTCQERQHFINEYC
jgi:hypothetical protein